MPGGSTIDRLPQVKNVKEVAMKRSGIACRISRELANMKCKNCFEAEVVCTKGAKEEPGKAAECECRLRFNPELLDYGFE